MIVPLFVFAKLEKKLAPTFFQYAARYSLWNSFAPGILQKDFYTTNHHPKGHHQHINESESPYEYLTDEKLIEDFESLVLAHLGVKL